MTVAQTQKSREAVKSFPALLLFCSFHKRQDGSCLIAVHLPVIVNGSMIRAVSGAACFAAVVFVMVRAVRSAAVMSAAMMSVCHDRHGKTACKHQCCHSCCGCFFPAVEKFHDDFPPSSG